MARFTIGQWVSAALATSVIVLSTSACTADPMRAYDATNSATDEYKSAVADFLLAVHSSDAGRLTELSGSDGTTAGVRELLARYAGAELSVTSYYFDHPGEAAATIAVQCTNGGRASFDQGFLGTDGHWRPEINEAQVIPADTAPPLPDQAQSAPESAPWSHISPTTSAGATYYDWYPPCSEKAVAATTS